MVYRKPTPGLFDRPLSWCSWSTGLECLWSPASVHFLETTQWHHLTIQYQLYSTSSCFLHNGGVLCVYSTNYTVPVVAFTLISAGASYFGVVRPLPKGGNRGGKCRSVRTKRGKFFSTLHFSVVWMGSRGTFVLCTAL